MTFETVLRSLRYSEQVAAESMQRCTDPNDKRTQRVKAAAYGEAVRLVEGLRAALREDLNKVLDGVETTDDEI